MTERLVSSIKKITVITTNYKILNLNFSKGEVRWSQGDTLFKFLKNVKVPQEKNRGLTLEFNNDGSLKTVELFIVNLQLDVEATKNAQTEIKRWEEIGTWQSFPAGKGIYTLGK